MDKWTSFTPPPPYSTSSWGGFHQSRQPLSFSVGGNFCLDLTQGLGDRGAAVVPTFADIGAQDSHLALQAGLSALARWESWAPMSAKVGTTAAPLSPNPWREVHLEMPPNVQAKWFP